MLDAYPRICIAEYSDEISLLVDVRKLRSESFIIPLLADIKTAWSSLNFSKLIWIFTVSSVAGFIVENIFAFIKYGSLQGRQGMLYGPFSQVYGIIWFIGDS